MPNRNLIAVLVLLALLSGCEMPQGGASKVVLPESDSLGAQVLKENCSKCHGVPSPAVHTAEEWPNVIYRMQEHRRMTGYSLIVPEELELLLDYLKRNAKS